MLSEHTYKRGGYYWFRRRVRCLGSAGFTVAFSLGVRDPIEAKRVGRRIDVEVDHMLVQMKAPSQGEVKHALKQFVALQERDWAKRLRVDLDRVAEVDVDRRESVLRNRHVQSRIYAALNALAAKHGRDCGYTAEIDAELVEQGHSQFERDKIRHRLGHGYAKEVYTPGSAVVRTPPLTFIDDQLRSLKAPATPEMRDWFLKRLAEKRAAIEVESAKRYAEALADFDNAYKTAAPQLPIVRHFADVDWPAPPFALADAVERGDFDVMMAGPFADAPIDAEARFGSASSAEAEPAPAETADDMAFGSNSPAPPAAPPIEPTVEPGAVATEAPTVDATPAEIPPSAASVAPPNSTAAAPTASIIPPITTLTELTDALIVANRRSWDPKTQTQYRRVAHLYAQVAGTEDLTKFSPTHPSDYCRVLDLLPRNYGKSSRERCMSLQDILKRGEALKAVNPDAVGLIDPTINRHITQLGKILTHARSSGFNIGDPASLRAFRRRDPRPDDGKTEGFELEEEITLFRHDQWTNIDEPVAPSAYWAPLLGAYTFERRAEVCGARRGDIDLPSGIFMVRGNAGRRLKNSQSNRLVPLHAELLRLGFLDYVKSLGGAPDEPLFPDLYQGKTPPEDQFAKQWTPILDAALPNARKETKTFRSFRSTGNTQLMNCDDVSDAIREELLGQVGKTVNTRNYKKRKLILPAALRRAVAKFPSVTSHLKPRKW